MSQPMNTEEENLIESRREIFSEEIDHKILEVCWIGKNPEIVKYLEASVILQKKEEISIYRFLFRNRKENFSSV